MNPRVLCLLVWSLVFSGLIPACTKSFSTPTLPPIPATSTPTSIPTAAATLSPSPTALCSPVTSLNITGNLNSAQAANSPGGVLNIGTNSAPILPFTIPNTFNSAKLNIGAYGSGNAIFQVADLTTPLDTTAGALPYHTTPAILGADSLQTLWFYGGGVYAWDQPTTLPPGASVVKTLTDIAGNPRQVTFLFYQVNDIGTASPPVNPNPPHQAAWAWFAFDTTGGKAPGSANLIEGTSIIQGSYAWINYPSSDCLYDRGITNNLYWGDLIYFNSDGSLASTGAMVNTSQGLGYQCNPEIILPPLNGWVASTSANNATPISLNFGTSGMLGYGQKNGLTGNAAASNLK
jgi:hypothetical protein